MFPLKRKKAVILFCILLAKPTNIFGDKISSSVAPAIRGRED